MIKKNFLSLLLLCIIKREVCLGNEPPASGEILDAAAPGNGPNPPMVVNNYYGRLSQESISRIETLEQTIQNGNDNSNHDAIINQVLDQLNSRALNLLTNETIRLVQQYVYQRIEADINTNMNSLVRTEMENVINMIGRDAIISILNGMVDQQVSSNIEEIVVDNINHRMNQINLTELIRNQLPQNIDPPAVPQPPPVFTDCYDAITTSNGGSGIYNIKPFLAEKAYPVYCESSSQYIYTHIQHRKDDALSVLEFDRNWIEYKNGFGDIGADSEFYIGNELIHLITSQRQYLLSINFMGIEIQFESFYINDESLNYKLNLHKPTPQNHDELTSLNGNIFQTFDHNDGHTCRQINGGWWYGDCTLGNLNRNGSPETVIKIRRAF